MLLMGAYLHLAGYCVLNQRLLILFVFLSRELSVTMKINRTSINRIRQFFFSLSTTCVFFASSTIPSTALAECSPEFNVVVIRHAERKDETKDMGISETGALQGQQFANRLVQNGCLVDRILISRRKQRHVQTAKEIGLCLEGNGYDSFQQFGEENTLPANSAYQAITDFGEGTTVYVMSSGQISAFINDFDWRFAAGSEETIVPTGRVLQKDRRYGEVYWLSKKRSENEWTLKIHKEGNADDQFSFLSPVACRIPN